VNDRPLSSFIDALAAGRRPKPFKAVPEDVEVLRAAIELRAARPGDAVPDEQFVSDLYQSLVEQADAAPATNVRPFRSRRARAVLVSVAASLVLVGGTFVATKSFNVPSPSPTTSAFGVPHRHALRTGTFETRGGVVLGQIVAYNGHPSWVYLNIGVSQSTGTIICKLQLENGSIVAAGVINLHRGIGELSKSVLVDISRLRGAQLSTSTGAVLASATFT
jgi:hypothetical protein